MKNKKGFTIIEILIVIAIIGILSTIAIIGMDPASYFKSARDNKREIHVSVIYGALADYVARNNAFPTCVADVGVEYDALGCKNYILNGNIPIDPLEGDCIEGASGYLIKKNSDYSIGVKANCAENSIITAGDWHE